MAQEVYRLADVKGLSPAVDPTRSGDQFVLNGNNYLFDAIGPKSAFGNRLLLPHSLPESNHVQGIRLKLRSGDRCFTFTESGILEWNEKLGGWRYVYVTDSTAPQPYRWTYGFLSGNMFFCHPQVGIIQYNLDKDLAGALRTEGAPLDAIAICVDNGRLVAVTPEYLFWSDPSDGTNFSPKLGGAGFQKLAARVPGFPVMVSTYARGVLTWTTGGVLRSEFTGDQETYRHRALNTEYRPINSFCVFQSDENTVVILDERGFFQSQGEAPTPYAPLFNEFLINWLQENNLRLGQNVRLEWDELQRLLFISYSFSRFDPIYESAFVLYPPTQKWGQFNEKHYGILPFRVNSGPRLDDYYGFVDKDRKVKVWKRTPSREVMPVDAFEADLFYPPIQKPFHYADRDSATVLSSSMAFDTFNAVTKTQAAGLYPRDGKYKLPPRLTDLGAKISLGFFRSSKEMSHDELSELIQIMVRSYQSGGPASKAPNFELVAPTPQVDYSLLGEGALYPSGEINYTDHQIRILPTTDGVTIFGEPVIPQLVGFSRGARHYSCSAVGIWHIIEVSAETLGQAFHLRTLEITGTSAGRLF